MGLVLALHAAIGFGLLLRSRMGTFAVVIGLVAPLGALAWWCTHLGTVLDGGVIEETHRWVPTLDLTLDLRFDGFAALMVLIVSGIGVAVFAYAASYFGAGVHMGRLIGLLTLFSGAMLGVVLADNLLLLYGFWELTSVTSFLLIGDQYRLPAARSAALQAILVTGAGGLAMLFGFVILGTQAGTYRLSAILADPPAGAAVTAALVLIAVGAFTKSAQYPFHGWLPGAMVAPTPVSAYLHSATMVKAGVYLIARLAPVFAVLATGWRPLVVGVGLLSMVGGGLRALRQHDLKLLLAYGTISQLGFMVVLFGVGLEAATLAGCAVILAHALFKATLFMIVGVVDHGTGTRDIRRLPALGPEWRSTASPPSWPPPRWPGSRSRSGSWPRSSASSPSSTAGWRAVAWCSPSSFSGPRSPRPTPPASSAACTDASATGPTRPCRPSRSPPSPPCRSPPPMPRDGPSSPRRSHSRPSP